MAQLTIPAEVTSATYTVTDPQTVFPFTFAVFAKTDLHFSVDGVELLQSDFVLSGTPLEGGGYQGGTVTLNVAVESVTCRLWRSTVAVRTSNFAPSPSVPVRDLDVALNRLTAIAQDIQQNATTGGGGSGGDVTSAEIVSALGFTPENASHRGAVNGYAPLDGSGKVATSNLNLSAIKSGAALDLVENKSSATIRGELTSANVTTALTFTPYNATNPANYLTTITSGNVTTALGFTPENTSHRGAANGYAPLDASGKVPAANLNFAGLNYQGTYNATTNTPALPAASAGNSGYFYVVTTAGTSGGVTYSIGDWALSNGTTWQDVPNSSAVSSVAALTGTITAAGLKTALSLDVVENKTSATIRGELTSGNVTTALTYTPADTTLSNVTPASLRDKAMLVTGAGTATRTLGSMLADAANVNDYLNSGDANYDGAFSRAIAARGRAYAPDKPALGGTKYTITAPIALGSGQGLRGDGSRLSIIENTTTSTAVVQIAAGAVSVDVTGVGLRHSGTPIAGGDGLNQVAGSACDLILLQDVYTTNCYVGFNLKTVSYGSVYNCRSDFCIADAFSETAASNAPLQWYFDQCTGESSGGAGFLKQATGAGAGVGAGVSTGEYANCDTFNNVTGGIRVLGRADNPIYAVRVEGGFFGQDGSHEIYLDAYGNDHVIRPTTVELAGQRPGQAVSTGACGIYLTGNNITGATVGGVAAPYGVYGNANSLIQPGRTNGAAADGIYIASRNALVGAHISSNHGQGAVRGSGINVVGSEAGAAPPVIGLVRAFGNLTAGISSDQDGLTIGSCNLNGNTVPVNFTGTTSSLVISGCLPTAINFSGTITGNLNVTGTITSGGRVTSGGGLSVGGTITGATTIAASGNVSGGSITSSGGLAAGGAITGATTIAASGTITGGALVSGSNLTVSGTVSGVTTLTVSTDIVSNGTAHFNGATAFTSGGVFVTAGGMNFTAAGGSNGIVVDNVLMRLSGAVGLGSVPVTTGVFNVSNSYQINGATH